MPQSKTRDRTGYVMVKLTADERRHLEQLRDRRAEETGERTTFDSTIRHLIRAAALTQNNS